MDARRFLIPPLVIATLAAVFSAFNVFESIPISPMKISASQGAVIRSVPSQPKVPGPAREPRPSETIANPVQVVAPTVEAVPPVLVAAATSTVSAQSNSVASPAFLPATVHGNGEVDEEVLIGNVAEPAEVSDVGASESYVVPPSLMTQATPLEAQSEIDGEPINSSAAEDNKSN